MSISQSINLEEIAKINNLQLNNSSNNNINDMSKVAIPNRNTSKNFTQKNNQIYIKKNNVFKTFPKTKFKNKKFRIIKDLILENNSINEINNITNRDNSNNQYTVRNITSFSTDINSFKDQFSKTSKVLDDFKNTLKQTETISSKIIDTSYNIEHKLNYPSINYYYNNAKQTLNDINEKNKDIISNNSYDKFSDEDEGGYGEGDSFKAEGDDSSDFNLKDDNDNYKDCKKDNNKYIKNFLKNNQINIKSNNNEKEKINILNQKLTNSNSHLVIENKSIESELFRYKIKEKDIERENQIQNQKLPFNSFDISLKKFINNLKSSLQKNINDNLAIAKKIFNVQNEFQLCYKNNINQVNIYERLIKKINDENKRVANIQKYNIENSRRYNNLLQEKDILNNRLEKMKINIYDLKSKGKILSIKKESNLKSKKDTEELILKLYKAIQNMNNEISSKNSIKNKNMMYNNINNYSFSLLDEKINQLYNVISGIMKEKNMINSENIKIMDNIRNIENRSISLRKEGSKLNELNNDINNLKLQKMKITKDIEKKEDEIKMLKETIDKLSNGIKIDINNLKKICGDLPIKDESEKIKKENQLENDKLDKEINEAINLNSVKNNEIKSASKKYDQIINEKEQEIIFLENELKQKEQKEPLQDLEEKITQPMYYNPNQNMNGNENKNYFNDNNNFEYFKHDKNDINELKLNNDMNNDVIEDNKIQSDEIYNNYEDNKNNESNVSYEYFVDNDNEEGEQPNEYYEENMNGEEYGDEEYYYQNPEEEEYENNNENGGDNGDLEYKEIDPNNIELPEEYKEFNKNFEEEENEDQSDNIKENGNEKDKENN